MAANKYRRSGADVFKNGSHYARAKDEVAAATIVDALFRAEGREPPKP